jgi:hypothetical protein
MVNLEVKWEEGKSMDPARKQLPVVRRENLKIPWSRRKEEVQKSPRTEG